MMWGFKVWGFLKAPPFFRFFGADEIAYASTIQSQYYLLNPGICGFTAERIGNVFVTNFTMYVYRGEDKLLCETVLQFVSSKN